MIKDGREHQHIITDRSTDLFLFVANLLGYLAVGVAVYVKSAESK